MKGSKILIVDDERVITDILSDFLGIEGYNISTASSGPDALKLLEKDVFDIVISDLKMEPMSGLQLLEEVKKREWNVLVVIMTAFGTVETALEAMKKGAFDYILKPFRMEEVVQIVKRALAVKKLADENFELKETLSLYKMSEELDMSLHIEDIVKTLLNFTLNHIKADLLELYLYDRAGEKIELHHSISALNSAEHKMWFNPDSMKGLEGGIQPLVGDVSSAVKFANSDKKEIPESFCVVPMLHHKELLGYLVASSFSPLRKFTEGHRKFLAVMSSRASVSIINARLVEDMREAFRQTIQALTRALEAMDKYTSGHSDRVTLYCKLIGMEMNLDSETQDILTNTALLHDIGKFGCHANLNKPGKLTLEEYEIFKQHPNFGVEILEPISFLKPLLPGIKYHHERWDGKGYPEGLKGKEIPLIARILAVADAYDAMTSNRAYRKAMTHKVALNELQRCSETQFDPEVVNSFISAIEKYREKAIAEGISVPQ